MTSIIKFTPLSGAKDRDPLCYLLEIDDFVFLLDCGWDEAFKMDFITTLMMHISRIDAVLISHPDMDHLGALPYAVGELGLNCPIYVTLPVYEMGQMFLYDIYQSHQASEDFQLFTLDDVDAAFKMMHQLKYSQVCTLTGAGEGISIIPINGGHMLGGTIWKIYKEQEEIVYAVDYNHKTERHLAASTLPTIIRPSLLITDAYNMDMWMQAPRKKREKDFMDIIVETLRGDGNVLIPVDTAGRVLELLLLLDEAWNQRNLGVYPLHWLSHMGFNVLDFARSSLEWMSDNMMRYFQTSRGNPFDFKNMRIISKIDDLSCLPPGPRVVLCTMPGLSAGFARTLMTEWVGNEKNTIIFTTKPREGTLAYDLLREDRADFIDIEFKKRVSLEGDELNAFLRKQKEARDKREQIRREAEARLKMEQDMSDESDTEETIDPRLAHRHDIPMEIDLLKVSLLKNAPRFPMFPSIETRFKSDDYGIIVKAEDFVVAVDEDGKGLARMDVDEETQLRIKAEEAEDMEQANKCVVSSLHLDIKAKVRYVDFEGLSDGASKITILSQLAARQMVVVHGSEKSMDILTKHIQ
eukprot:Ihof_evm1s914 gene=Ihof_evmTU1s914